MKMGASATEDKSEGLPTQSSVVGTKSIASRVLEIEERLARDLQSLELDPRVTHVYNPVHHAKMTHEMFLEGYTNSEKEVLFLGMNPGPWGMIQTGIPFGSITMAKDWLGIEGPVLQPSKPHPKRPVLGFKCQRREVSGDRFWGFFKKHFESASDFFANNAVYNHCPLSFMSESGKNVTPADMKAQYRKKVIELCDQALVEIIDLLKVKIVVGIGRFAEKRARKALEGAGVKSKVSVRYMNHPSPASAVANKGWEALATKQLRELGILARIDPPNSNTISVMTRC